MRYAIPLLTLFLGCSTASYADAPVPRPTKDTKKAEASEIRTAVFAAGCFWCVEAVFEELIGVVDVTSGYAGGTAKDAKYDVVSSGGTTHAESVRIRYDGRIGYADLLWVLFSTHDPTTKDRQGPDHGRQYRSAIFTNDPQERAVAEQYIAELNQKKTFASPVVTTIEPLPEFHEAEAYHQNFVKNHPDHPYVRAWSRPKLEKLRTKLPQFLARKSP